jgi:hypothetical protein
VKNCCTLVGRTILATTVCCLISSAVGAQDIDHPLPLQMNVPTTFRLAADEHGYYGISLPQGDAKIILDVRRADEKNGNIIGGLTIRDEDGKVIQSNAIHMNYIEVEHRSVNRFSLRRAAKVILDVVNDSGGANFWLTVVKTPANAKGNSVATTAPTSKEQIPGLVVPLFGEKYPMPMLPGQPESGRLDKDEYAYFITLLPAGTYKAFLDFSSANRTQTNLIGDLTLMDEDGDTIDNVIHMNVIDSTHREVSMFSLKKGGVFVLKIYDAASRANFSTRIVPATGE